VNLAEKLADVFGSTGAVTVTETEETYKTAVIGERVYVYTDTESGRRALDAMKDALNTKPGDVLAWWGDPPEGEDNPAEWLNIDFGGEKAPVQEQTDAVTCVCPLCGDYEGERASVEAHISASGGVHQGEIGMTYRDELTDNE